jgi:predicted aspartyl protease
MCTEACHFSQCRILCFHRLAAATTTLALTFVLAVLPDTRAQSSAAQRPSAEGESDRAVTALDGLVQGKEYPELERQLGAAKLRADERAYFEGILADRNNQVSQAISMLEGIIPGLRIARPHRAAIALRALAGDYFKVGRYAASSDAYSDLLKHFASEFTKAERQTIQDNLHTFELFRDAAPQTISGNRSFTVLVQRDPTGDIDVPVAIGEVKQWWIFDTGANVSTITMSTARELGLEISKGSASTQSGATGTEIPLRGAVIPQLTFGSVIVRNVATLVMDDKSLEVAVGENKHYQIQGVLGYPVLAALGSFTIAGDEMAVAPESQPSARSSRLYVEELTPLLEATVAGQELLFGFDTGADAGSFSAMYLRKFPEQFTSLKTQKYGTAGAGGDVLILPAYHLPQIELHLGSATAMLKKVPVLTRDLGVDPLDQVYGNLGQSLLNQFRSYTIDFSRMRFSVGQNAH